MNNNLDVSSCMGCHKDFDLNAGFGLRCDAQGDPLCAACIRKLGSAFDGNGLPAKGDRSYPVNLVHCTGNWNHPAWGNRESEGCGDRELRADAKDEGWIRADTDWLCWSCQCKFNRGPNARGVHMVPQYVKGRK